MENKGSKYLLTFLTVLCFVLMIVSYIRNDAFDPVRNYVGYFLTPIEKGVNSVGLSVVTKAQEIAHLKDVSEKNKELEKKVSELLEENNRLLYEKEELSRLRELYELDNTYLSYPKVAARVISKDSDKWFQEFRIDKGLSDGITEGMNVLSGGGLCGIVTESGSNYATVRSIIDDESTVYAMSQISSDTCLVRGNAQLFDDGVLALTNIDKNARISNGDAIITSDLSTKYLPGLLIGYAGNIEVSSQQLSKSGVLIPVADFDNLQEVLIIKSIKTETGIVTPDENW